MQSFTVSSASPSAAKKLTPLLENEFRGKDLSNICTLHTFERIFLHAAHRIRQSGNSSPLSLFSCPDHPNKKSELYCLCCDEFACEECSDHSGHNVLPHEEAMALTKRDLSERVLDLTLKVTALVEFLPHFRQSFDNEVKAALEDQRRTIREFFEGVISRHPEDEEHCRMICDEILKSLRRPSPPTLAEKSTFFGPVVDIKEHFEVFSKFAQSLSEVEDVQLFFSGVSMLNKLFNRLEHPFLAFTPEQHLQRHLEVIRRPNTNIHHFKRAADAKRLPASLVEELKRLSSDELRQVTGFPEIHWESAQWVN